MMKKVKKITCFLVSLLLLIGLHSAYASTSTSDSVTLVWDKTPLSITLPVADKPSEIKQLQLTFPEKAKIAIPLSLRDKINVFYANDTFYLSAKESFGVQPNVMVKTITGKIILLNLSASQSGLTTPVFIQYADIDNQANKTNHGIYQAQQASSSPFNQMYTVSMPELVRYAVQQLYAPKRLLKAVSGITQTQTFNAKAYPLFLDGSTLAVPLYSFAGGGYIVTAVYVRNMLNIPLDIKPQSICGKWIAVSPFPISRLTPYKSAHDASTLFLVSRNDFVSQLTATCDHGARGLV